MNEHKREASKTEYRIGIDGTVEEVHFKPIDLRNLLLRDPFARLDHQRSQPLEARFRRLIEVSFRGMKNEK